ncbi:hypothetical protein J6590_062077 [Homalodisca vitripennis]|nr:hypothetical protein J6590_062077 [Homalodisca vitripennis]
MGHRIGKGEGFSDLEYAVMAACGTVTEDTVIVTTVHDEQIFDKLPHELFQPFDVPVDFIVTPTQVIEVTPRLPKPKGILWNVLSDRRLQLIPMLKTLRDKDMKSGKDCTLKEVDSEPEERTRPYYRPSLPRRRMYVPPRRPSQESRNNSPQGRRTRTFRRGGSQRKQVDGSGDADVTTNFPSFTSRGPMNKDGQRPSARHDIDVVEYIADRSQRHSHLLHILFSIF